MTVKQLQPVVIHQPLLADVVSVSTSTLACLDVCSVATVVILDVILDVTPAAMMDAVVASMEAEFVECSQKYSATVLVTTVVAAKLHPFKAAILAKQLILAIADAVADCCHADSFHADF